MNSPWGPPSSFYGSEYDQETLQNLTASHNIVNTPSILDPTRAALSYGLALPIAVSNESQQQLFVCQNQLIHLQQLVIRQQRIIFEQEQRINSQQQLIQQQQQLLQPPSQSAPEQQWLSSPSVVPDTQHLSLDQPLPDFLTSPPSSSTDLLTAPCQLTATGEQLNIMVRFIHADADRLPFPAVVIGDGEPNHLVFCEFLDLVGSCLASSVCRRMLTLGKDVQYERFAKYIDQYQLPCKKDRTTQKSRTCSYSIIEDASRYIYLKLSYLTESNNPKEAMVSLGDKENPHFYIKQAEMQWCTDSGTLVAKTDVKAKVDAMNVNSK